MTIKYRFLLFHLLHEDTYVESFKVFSSLAVVDFNCMSFCTDSTFRFLVEKWKDNLPPGYVLKEASVDQPFEQDACHSHFVFAKDRTLSSDSELVLKYQWFIGERTPTNFVAIADAAGEVLNHCITFILQ